MKYFNYKQLIILQSLLGGCWVANVMGTNEKGVNKLEYHINRQIAFGHGNNPLWLNANNYGISSIKSNNGLLQLGVDGEQMLGNTYNLTFQYGADIVSAYNNSSSLFVQQLYGGIQYKSINLTIGSKQHPANQKNAELSSGSQTLGTNSRPIPEIRIEAPQYINLFKKSWIGIKFHLAYGIPTDQNWQKRFAAEGERYTTNTWTHTKSGFLRIGDEDKFPLVWEGGLEWATQFGGTSHNTNFDGINEIKSSANLKDFFYALYGGGSDPTDYYKNSKGNSLGSWLFSLSYKLNNTKFRIYLDRFFEDHSQMFLEYGLKDGLFGFEATLPQNPYLTSLVYEYIRTDNQTGPIYHDGNSTIPDQISAIDNYYNHTIYTGWQHWGQAIGNPLYTSPIYNTDHKIRFQNNRFRAHHFGIAGGPAPLHYRLLYTYSQNLGTYSLPFDDKIYSTSFLAELAYAPKKIGHFNTQGNSIKCSIAFDRGKLLGNNIGFQLSLISQGHINTKKQAQ